jgi:hypothetical protein
MAKSIMGKPKDDELVKEVAAQALKKKYPLVPKRAIRKGVDKQLSKSNKRGQGIW